MAGKPKKMSQVKLTSPHKTGAVKSRELAYELLILNRRTPNEKIKVYGGPDCFCDQTG